MARRRATGIGIQKRPSPEISRALRAERGMMGWQIVWMWRDHAVSRSIRRRRVDGGFVAEEAATVFDDRGFFALSFSLLFFFIAIGFWCHPDQTHSPKIGFRWIVLEIKFQYYWLG